MKAFPWIVAIAAVGTAVYVVMRRQNQQRMSGGDLDSAADNVGFWGSKQRVSGAGSQIGGNLKQGLGKLTGDRQMQGEGVLDQAVGTVKDAAGKAARAVSDTLR